MMKHLLPLLLALALPSAHAGQVETRDGRRLEGALRLESAGTLLVTPSNAPPLRVALSNLLRANFILPSNAPPARPPRPALPVLDEDRGALPEPWTGCDVGTLEARGKSGHYRGTFTVEATPLRQAQRDDGLHVIHRALQGDGEIIARVASLEPRDAKEKQPLAGVLLRGGLETGSEGAFLGLTGGGGVVFRRWYQGKTRFKEERRADWKPPYWVKLVRAGPEIAAYLSTDGQRWSLHDQGKITLPERAWAGVAVASRRTKSPARATFDHLTARRAEPEPPYLPRLVLRNGTVLVDLFTAVDGTSVTFSKEKAGLTLWTKNIARLDFRNVPESSLPAPGRSGVLLRNGDFIDGEFRGLDGGKVKLMSVLFGLRSYDLSAKVAAVVLGAVASSPAIFEVATCDGSLWRCRAVAIGEGALRVEEPFAGACRIPAAAVVELRALTR